MTYDPDKHDGLVIAPETDGFNHETPLRAFTDWQDKGLYAVGRGFRPAVQHLASYLDAIERKEGWQLGQLFMGPDNRPSAAWFRREPWKVDPYKVLADMIFHAPASEGERKTAMRPELGMGYGTPDVRVDGVEVPVIQPDDPINPRHYGGTHCAEIGERMTANCYQVLKYCWRLGEKDDPVQELGKAIWYAAREKLLGPSRSRGSGPLPGMKQDFVLERTEGSPRRREIAMLLWDMCYGFGTPAHWHCAAYELIRVLQEKKREMTPSAKP